MEKIFKSSRMRPSWEMCASNTYLNITIIRHEYHFTCVSLQGDYLHSMRSNHCQSADYNQNKSINSPFSALDLIPDIESKINVLINQFKEFQTGFNRKHESSREKWMGASEAMQYMNVTKNTFDRYRYELTPKLPGYPVKGKVFYSKDDIDEWIRSYMYRSQVLSWRHPRFHFFRKSIWWKYFKPFFSSGSWRYLSVMTNDFPDTISHLSRQRIQVSSQ